MNKPYKEMSLIEFQRRFRTEKACRKHLFKLRWPEGFICPVCGHNRYFDLPKRGLYQCKACGYQASLTAGTIMHKTRTPLRKWFWAIFLAANDKRGVSALQLCKKLDVSYYVAWNMLHKIRKAMQDRDYTYELRGIIEIDDAFFGGPSEGGDKRGRGTNKAKVLIEASTNGEAIGFARMRVVQNIDGPTIEKVVANDIAPKQTLRSDGWSAYGVVKGMGHQHDRQVSNGRKANEVLKWVHILASNAKAFLLGTFHGIGKKHLQAYLDEFCYRFNRRWWEGELFDRLLTACTASKGITFSELTA